MIGYCKKFKREVISEANCYSCPYEKGDKNGSYWCNYFNKEGDMNKQKEIEHFQKHMTGG